MVAPSSKVEDFRFHDLRARALTDAEKHHGIEYARTLAAHMNIAMEISAGAGSSSDLVCCNVVDYHCPSRFALSSVCFL